TRYTERSSRFTQEQGSWQALSPTNTKGNLSGDSPVDKELAVAYMADLAAHWRKKEVRAKFEKETQVLQHLNDLLGQGTDRAAADIRERLDADKSRQTEAFVRDLIECRLKLGVPSTVTVEALGLSDTDMEMMESAS